MTDFSNIYKDGIDRLCVPDYSIEELGSSKQHKKYVKQKKYEGLVTALFLMVLFSVAASATVYAAYTVCKNIQFTSYGLKIDFSDPEGQSDPDEVISYTDVYNAPAYSQEDFKAESVTQDFDNWDDALEVIGFPVVCPQTVQYSELNIEYCQTHFFELVRASYIALGKLAAIEYTCYLDDKWSFAIDYNTQIIDNYVYTNKYDYDFWITVCQYDISQSTKVVAYINNYMIQLTFYGYEDNEIYEILEELDLSVYG